MTQERVNGFIKQGRFGISELVQFLHQGQVYAVSIDFYKILVGPNAPLYIQEDKFKKNKKLYKVPGYFKAFVHELQRMGIALFVIDNTTDENSVVERY